MKYIGSFLAFILFTIPILAQNSLQKRLDSLTKAYEEKDYHGVVLVAKGDKVLYQKGYGFANFDKKIKHTPATLFKTESVGKMFTAVSIMQLVERGQLRLDQTIKELVPELKIKNADKITVHHLLTHTSGLQSPWDNPKWNFKINYSRQELMQLIEELPLVFDVPGKEWYYSNAGYIILGWIIEKKTGLAFDQYFQKYLFGKLGMTHTRQLKDTIMPELTGAQPYRIISSKKYLLLNEKIGPQASAAGGWISTAGDLHKFMAALYANRLLKPKTWQMMRTANDTNPKDSAYQYYAYGLETHINDAIPGTSIYGHNGGGSGFNIDAFIDPATGYIVISCTNLYQNSRWIMLNYMKAALNQPIPPFRPSMTVQLFDLIEQKGIDSFMVHSATFLKEIDIDFHPGFVAEIGDSFWAIQDYSNWRKWMQYGISVFPKEPMLFILQGDGQLQLQDKAGAIKSYEAAKALAATDNNQYVLRMADEKLKTL